LDNLTHSLFAITLGRTPLGRAGRGTTAALLLASNAPDIDAISAIGGAPNYLVWHRGPTHGPLGIVGLGVLTAGIVRAAYKYLPRRHRTTEGEAPFGMLVIVSIVGGLCHVLMDLPTSYGLRFLAPFRWDWFALDWLPIVDVYLLAVLAAGLIFGRTSADARRRNAAIALLLMATNYGVRGAAHHRALTLAPRLFGPTLPPSCDAGSSALQDPLAEWPHHAPRPARLPPPGRTRCLMDMAAIPTISPVNWVVIAQMSNAYEVHRIELMDTRFREPAAGSEVFWRQSVRYPNVWTPEVERAAATRLGQVFLGFSRFPAARALVDSHGMATVRFTDVRFIGGLTRGDLPDPRTNLFTAVIRIDQHGQIASERLGR
jgi:hypothetical protein